MTPKINWTMHVAVISDQHAPQFASSPDTLTFRDADGGTIVYIEGLCEADLTDQEVWLLPLSTLLCPLGFGWVRFDPDADVIEGLPVFEQTAP